MRAILLVLVVIGLTACAIQPTDVTWQQGECCAVDDYATFSVRVEDMPGFLQPIMLSNFTAAMSTRGLQPVDQNADLAVILRYEQTDFPVEEEIDTSFGERTQSGGSVQFMAKIVVDMQDGEGATVWSGSIQRLHYVTLGEWMHTGQASGAVYDAFIGLLEDYPGSK